MTSSMKQYSGADIPRLMAEMPAELVEKLQADHSEHRITEREARWWGFLQFARTDGYEGDAYVIVVNGTGEEMVQRFLPYVLSNRAGDERFGIVRAAWPDMAVTYAGGS